MLDMLLKAKSSTVVAVNLVRVLNDHLPIDFNAEINKSTKSKSSIYQTRG